MHLFLSVPKYQWKSSSKIVHLYFHCGQKAPFNEPHSILKLIQAFEENLLLNKCNILTKYLNVIIVTKPQKQQLMFLFK